MVNINMYKKDRLAPVFCDSEMLWEGIIYNFKPNIYQGFEQKGGINEVDERTEEQVAYGTGLSQLYIYEKGETVFEYKYRFVKKELKTEYASVCVKNIIFEPAEIEKMLPHIVLNDDNLKYMFSEKTLNSFKKRNIYKRFIPKDDALKDLDTYISECLENNKSFYSFLAEGVLALVFRDLLNYKLAKAVIDVHETLVDSHTGADACMYDENKKILIQGEAKFYESLNAGMRKIIDDFMIKNIRNKLESMQRAVENNEESIRIIMKNLETDEYKEFTIGEFLNQKIVFAGFVLHSEEDVTNYSKESFYDDYYISVEQIERNIRKCLSDEHIDGDYEIVMIHLPISNKKTLIKKVIENSKEKLNKLNEVGNEQ